MRSPASCAACISFVVLLIAVVGCSGGNSVTAPIEDQNVEVLISAECFHDDSRDYLPWDLVPRYVVGPPYGAASQRIRIQTPDMGSPGMQPVLMPHHYNSGDWIAVDQPFAQDGISIETTPQSYGCNYRVTIKTRGVGGTGIASGSCSTSSTPGTSLTLECTAHVSAPCP